MRRAHCSPTRWTSAFDGFWQSVANRSPAVNLGSSDSTLLAANCHAASSLITDIIEACHLGVSCSDCDSKYDLCSDAMHGFPDPQEMRESTDLNSQNDCESTLYRLLGGLWTVPGVNYNILFQCQPHPRIIYHGRSHLALENSSTAHCLGGLWTILWAWRGKP